MSAQTTIAGMIFETAATCPDKPLFYLPVEDGTGQVFSFMPVSWGRFAGDIRAMAGHFSSVLGAKGERIALLCPTCYEWEVVEKAALAAGLVVVGIETHATLDMINHILRHSGARHLFIDDAARLSSLDRQAIAGMRSITIMRKNGVSPEQAHWYSDITSVPHEDYVVEKGDGDRDAILLYTSGSTGVPKAIMYSERQMLAAAEGILGLVHGQLDSSGRLLCWLPLSNLYQRVVNLLAMLRGMTIYVVSDTKKIAQAMPAVEPVFLAGVPRFYEKLQAAIAERLNSLPFPMKQIVSVSMAVGLGYHRAMQKGAWYAGLLRIPYRVVKTVCLDRIAGAAMGRRLRFLVSGSAKCPVRVIEFFAGIGVPVFEAYGITENMTPIAMNVLGAWRIGSVGKPLNAHSVVISGEGEVLVKGPGMFKGYMDEKGVVSARDSGYYHTGDFGHIDKDGFLFLTGRQSELLKTSTGRKIPVLPLEAELNRIPRVSQSVIIGNERKHLTAILSVREKGADAGAKDDGILLREIANGLAAFNGRRGAYERVPGALVLFREFSAEQGDLTPNLKIRRNALAERYSREIGELYTAVEKGAKAPVKSFAGTGLALLTLGDLP